MKIKDLDIHLRIKKYCFEFRKREICFKNSLRGGLFEEDNRKLRPEIEPTPEKEKLEIRK